MKDKKQKLVLPPHKSKRSQWTVPGMTEADVEEPRGESPGADHISDEGSDSQSGMDEMGESGQGSGSPATDGSGSEVELIELSSDSGSSVESDDESS